MKRPSSPADGRLRFRLLAALVAMATAVIWQILPEGWLAAATAKGCPAGLSYVGHERIAYCWSSGSQIWVWTQRGLGALALLGTLPLALYLPKVAALPDRAWVPVARGLVRATCVLGFVAAWSDPTLIEDSDARTLVVAIDASASVDPRDRARAQAFADELESQITAMHDRGSEQFDPRHVHRVYYAADAQRHRDRQKPFDPPNDNDSDDWANASRHADAIAMGRGLMTPQRQAHMVLLGDGRGTPWELAELDRALRNLPLSVHTVTWPAARGGGPRILDVDLPMRTQLAQSVPAVLRIFSSDTTQVNLHAEIDGLALDGPSGRPIALEAGVNTVTLPVRTLRRGVIEVRARLGSPGESPSEWTGNVTASRGQPRALYIGSKGVGRETGLLSALAAGQLSVDARTPAQLAQISSDELTSYDLFIIANLPASAIARSRQAELRSAVEDRGVGLLMIGGDRAYGIGGWQNAALAPTLPVTFSGEREEHTPSVALMLVIDKSGSMASDDKIELVKQAALATARTLDERDEIGVIAFDSRPRVLVRLQAARHRSKIAGSIRRLSAGGGTHALPALREAKLQLDASRARIKHVILLSDGQSPSSGLDALLADMRDAAMTVSTIGVGAGAGKELLTDIARLGHGRYYYSADGTDVPRIFSAETREVSRNAVRETQHRVRVHTPDVALRGLRMATAPPLAGLVGFEALPRSQTLLTTSSKSPLLVTGRRGLGKAAAFASDAGARWAKRWLAWPDYARFWVQLARDLAREGALEQSRELDLAGHETVAGRWRFDLVVPRELRERGPFTGALAIVDAQGEVVAEQEMRSQVPGYHFGEIDSGRLGLDPRASYLVRARLWRTDDAERDPQVRALGRMPARLQTELHPDLQKPSRSWAQLPALELDAGVDGDVDVDVDAANAPAARAARAFLARLEAGEISSPEGHEPKKRHRRAWVPIIVFVILPLLVLDLAAGRVLRFAR